MAIAFDAANHASFSATNTLTFSHTCTGSNRVLFVAVTGSGGVSVNSVTYNGVAMTAIISGAGSQNLWVFGLIAPATGANNVVVTLSDAFHSGSAASASYTGVNQAGGSSTWEVNGSANIVANNASVSVTTTTDNDWVLGAMSCNSVTSITASQTERTRDTTGGAGGFNIYFEDTNGVVHPAGSQQMKYTTSGSPSATIGAVGFTPATSTAWTKSLSDSISLSESFIKSPARNLSESISLSESFLRGPGKSVKETFSITEAFVIGKVYAKTLLDSLSISELFSKGPGKSLSDNINISESLNHASTKSFSDSFSLTDTLQRATTKIFAEIITISEFIDRCLNGLSPIWGKKYNSPGSSYSTKYTSPGTSYASKYSSPGSSYSPKYPHPPC